jgi:pimeloyl-ACP methyl ester carboxylesterase
VDAFADALAGFLDAVGLNRVGLFGTHTGGILATRFAVRYPERAAAVISNGLLLMDEADRVDKLAHSFPAFHPTPCGGHLAWLWTRQRDQLVFYPWYHRTASARIAWPMTLEQVQHGVCDFLRAGDNYRSAYRAVNAYDVRPDLQRLLPPALFVVASGDALARYWDSFPPLPKTARIVQAASQQESEDRAVEFLEAFVANQPAADLLSDPAPPTRLSRRLAATSTDVIHALATGPSGGRPVVLMHDWGRSSDSLRDVAGGFVGRRPVIIPDLPGHGETTGPEPQSTAECAGRVVAVLSALGVTRADVVFEGGSWILAAEMLRQAPDRFAGLAIADPFVTPEGRAAEMREALPDFRPDWSGSHLTRMWHFARDQSTAWPWYDRSREAALSELEPEPPWATHQRVVDLVRSAAAYPGLHSLAVDEAREGALRSLEDSAAVFATPGQSAARRPSAAAPLPAVRGDWAFALLAALGRR